MIIFESFNKYCHLFFNFFYQFLQSKNIRINFICTSDYMFQISMFNGKYCPFEIRQWLSVIW